MIATRIFVVTAFLLLQTSPQTPIRQDRSFERAVLRDLPPVFVSAFIPVKRDDELSKLATELESDRVRLLVEAELRKNRIRVADTYLESTPLLRCVVESPVRPNEPIWHISVCLQEYVCLERNRTVRFRSDTWCGGESVISKAFDQEKSQAAILKTVALLCNDYLASNEPTTQPAVKP